ncbi:hypothetical protein JXA80_00200, partial [bacterium]|nr:hypothetical protein [candidate division CSSED10-310 bacterium]
MVGMITVACLLMSTPSAEGTAAGNRAASDLAARDLAVGRSGSRLVLYDNGPLITTPGGGAGGADISELQTSLGMNTHGAGCQVSLGNRMADDFDVLQPWNIESIHLYAYQTNSTTTSPLVDARLQIWDGPPNAGGTVIWGDLVTNRLLTTEWTSIYRVSDSSPSDTNRPIMVAVCEVPVTLDPGTYWLDWMLDGSPSLSGPFQPPISIIGSTTTGNALQYTTAWNAFLDSGTSTAQGVPFTIHGNLSGGTLIDFDDLSNLEYIDSHYPDVVFSPGWQAWTTSSSTYPPHSPPNVAFTHETAPDISFDIPIWRLGFYINCLNSGSDTYTYTVNDEWGYPLQDYTVNGATDLYVEFFADGIRSLTISGTGPNWSVQHTIDSMIYYPSEYLDCPPNSVFSQPVDVTSPLINGYSSDLDFGSSTVDWYLVSSGESVSSIRWWGFLSSSSTPEFRIEFLMDDAGSPGTPAQSFTVTPSVWDTGYDFYGYDLLEFDVDLPQPVFLTHGWLSIRGVLDGVFYYWANTSIGPDLGLQNLGSGWNAINSNMAVCLNHSAGPPTPTPTPLTCDILWDQPLSAINTNAYISQEFPDMDTYSSYLSDDFINPVSWTISEVYAPGELWNGGMTLMHASMLHWRIYADQGGVPAGDPSGGGAAPFWSLDLPPYEAQVTISTGSNGYPSNTAVTLATPVTLPAGHWWICFYPTMNYDIGGQFGRQGSDTTNALIAQFINPGEGF